MLCEGRCVPLVLDVNPVLAPIIAIAFKKRTNKSHQSLGVEYVKITSKTVRKDFVKKKGTRFTQLSRLPHFDTVRGIVVDPMHNLLRTFQYFT